MKRVHITLPMPLWIELKRLAREQETNFTELVREAVKDFLTKEQDRKFQENLLKELGL